MYIYIYTHLYVYIYIHTLSKVYPTGGPSHSQVVDCAAVGIRPTDMALHGNDVYISVAWRGVRRDRRVGDLRTDEDLTKSWQQTRTAIESVKKCQEQDLRLNEQYSCSWQARTFGVARQ